MFSNYPFLREQEVTFPASAVPLNGAWSQQDPNFPFNQYLPNRIVRTAGANGTYQIRDGTNVTRGADGTLNPIDPATGLPTRGNIAETFEFRAVDRNLQYAVHPAVQLRRPARARGGHDARSALRRQQGHQAARVECVQPGIRLQLRGHAGLHLRAVQPGVRRGREPERRRSMPARRRAHAASAKRSDSRTASLGGMLDYNLANAGGAVIGFEARGPILGFNIPEAVLLGNTGRSLYNSVQFNLVKRMSNGVQFNMAYTLLALEGHQLGRSGQHGRRRQAGRAECGLRRARQSARTRCELRPVRLRSAAPVQRQLRVGAAGQGALGGFRLSGFVQLQSGLPYSISRPSRSWATRVSTATSFAVPVAFIASASDGRACAARSMSSVRPATTRPRRRSTRACSARRRRRRAGIQATWASATSAATCCEASGSAGWT